MSSGRHAAGCCAEQPVFPRPRAAGSPVRHSRRARRPRAAHAARASPARAPRARRCGNRNRRALRSCSSATLPKSSDSSPAASRRDRSISKKRSWACTKPVAVGEIDAIGGLDGRHAAAHRASMRHGGAETRLHVSAPRAAAASRAARTYDDRRAAARMSSAHAAPTYFSMRMRARLALFSRA